MWRVFIGHSRPIKDRFAQRESTVLQIHGKKSIWADNVVLARIIHKPPLGESCRSVVQGNDTLRGGYRVNILFKVYV